MAFSRWSGKLQSFYAAGQQLCRISVPLAVHELKLLDKRRAVPMPNPPGFQIFEDIEKKCEAEFILQKLGAPTLLDNQGNTLSNKWLKDASALYPTVQLESVKRATYFAPTASGFQYVGAQVTGIVNGRATTISTNIPPNFLSLLAQAGTLVELKIPVTIRTLKPISTTCPLSVTDIGVFRW